MKQEKNQTLDFFKSLLFKFFYYLQRGKDKIIFRKSGYTNIFVQKSEESHQTFKKSPIPELKQTTIKPDSKKTFLKLLPQHEREQQPELLVMYLAKHPTQSL